MDKQKKQHKPIVCRKHTIIERERLLAHEDIINDTQYSGKEEGTQIVAYWKDEETGETLVSDAYSKGKLKGSGWYFPTALKQPEVPIYDWTPNYTGEGYVEIPEWQGVAGGIVEFEFVINSDGVIIDDNDGSGRLYVEVVNGLIVFTTYSYDVYVDDAKCINNVTRVDFNVAHKCRIVIKTTSFVGVNYFGCNYQRKKQLNGTIKNIKLTKADGSDNRFYESVIKSETEPETLVLEDSISGKYGTLKNFPENAVWKVVTTQLPVGEHTLKEGELISFTRDSYAWLEGKSYEPNEPRYMPDGKLLVEGQATNLVRRLPNESYGYMVRVDGKLWITSKNSGAILQVAMMGEHMTANVPHVVSFTINKDHIDAPFLNRFVGVNADTFPIPEKIIYTKTELGTRVSAEFTPVSPNTSIGFFLYPSEAQKTEPVPLMYTDFQVEKGAISTSYIPTTGTAVTRAADIATVRSIN